MLFSKFINKLMCTWTFGPIFHIITLLNNYELSNLVLQNIFKNNTCDGCFKFWVRESTFGTEPNRYRVYSFEMLLGTFKMGKTRLSTLVLGTKKRGKLWTKPKLFIIFELPHLSHMSSIWVEFFFFSCIFFSGLPTI